MHNKRLESVYNALNLCYHQSQACGPSRYQGFVEGEHRDDQCATRI
jgi:hypothetical protein